ncbi:hypothetical protein FN846DRAFT_924623 [Sphaerosporella brunnea]|uniref:Uncharacterized protein n=1 Tax=Sphaerosporella brunnea TaxID=1250544 RepID=A0A5J5FBT4_9PEZI|nr:hypothetical protein FN846DRAFT_924623 [Sphaerosporella brunnea]
MSHDSKTRSGGQVNLSPSPGPVSTTTTDVPSVHSPALTDQVHQSASTIFKSPVPSRATKSPQESVGPKSIIYQDGAEFLKVLEDLVKQGSAAVEVGVGDGVVMRFSPSVSHLSTASVSPTSSTNPSSVSSKPSKASDFAKEAIKRLETVQGMRTTIVGGHNKPVDSGPVNDLDANKTVKSTIVGGHNKPVDTEPVSDLDDEKIVKSAIAGGLMDYNKPVDTRIARETSGPAKRIMEMKRAILGGHAAYYNKPVDASSYQKETAHAIKKEAVPALKQKPAPIPKKATPVAKEEAPRATKATAPIPKAPVVSDAEEVAAPASKGSGPKLSVDEAVRLSLKDPAQFWGYWPAPTPRAPRPPRTRQPKYCPIKGWKNDRRGSHDHLY